MSHLRKYVELMSNINNACAYIAENEMIEVCDFWFNLLEDYSFILNVVSLLVYLLVLTGDREMSNVLSFTISILSGIHWWLHLSTKSA